MHTQDDLALARRHVQEGEARVLRQIELMRRDQRAGIANPLSALNLEAMEVSLDLMRAHLARMEADMRAG